MGDSVLLLVMLCPVLFPLTGHKFINLLFKFLQNTILMTIYHHFFRAHTNEGLQYFI